MKFKGLTLLLVFILSFSAIHSQNDLLNQLQLAKNEHPTLIELPYKGVVSDEDPNLSDVHKIGKHLFVNIDKNVILNILNSKPKVLEISLPLPGFSQPVSIELFNKKPFRSTALVKTSDGKVLQMPKGEYYRGIIKGDEKSLVAISFFEGEMAGVISTSNDGQYDIGRVKGSDIHVIYDASTLPDRPTIECNTVDQDLSQKNGDILNSFDTRDVGDCVNTYFEADNELFLNKGSVEATVAYINGFFNITSTIYNIENLDIAISEIFVWTTPDPFPTNNSGNVLSFFRTFRPSFNGDLAHLVGLGGNGLGGVAYLDVLCDFDYNYAFSDINPSYQEFPNYSWTVNVVSHEMGHNFGSNHTHWCGWVGGALDNCYETEGNCPPGPNPPNGGTMMSYCHLTSEGVNFSLAFGQQPGNKMRSRVANASCLGECQTGCPPIDINGTTTQPTCNGNNNGSITVSTPTTGVGPFTYQWSDGGSTRIRNNLSAGNYTVTVTDNNQCTSVETFILINPPLLVLEANIVDNDCSGESNGSIEMFVSGGVPDYSYFWSTGSTAPMIQNLPTGNYTLTLSDDFGCTIVEVYTVLEPDPILVFPDIDNISCHGANDGSIALDVVGGTSPYNISWNNGESSEVIFNLNEGLYIVTITDENDCQSIANFSITSPPELLLNINTTDVTFPGGSDGTATANANGGTPGYQYLWSTGETSPSISGLEIGFYSLTVTDQNGCSKIEEFVITGPNCSLTADISGQSPSCFNQNSGNATVTPSNQSGNVTYTWSNGATTRTINNLTAGTYVVTITDNNCSILESITLTNPSAILVSTDATAAQCSQTNGSVSATASGGTGNLHYLWSNGATTSSVSNLGPGTYYVTVSDDNGCSSIEDATIISIDNEAPYPIQNEITLYLDENGEVANLADIIAMFQDNCNSFSINSGILEVLNCNYLGTNTTVVIATDAANNTSENNILITLFDTIPPNITCPTNIEQGLCQGQIVDWTPIQISDNCNNLTLTQIEGLPTGSTFPEGKTLNIFEVRDQSGNVTTCQFTVSILPGLVLNSIVKNISCTGLKDGSISIDTSNLTFPFSFKWSNGSDQSSISGLSSGQYTVTVTDGNNCTSEQVFEIFDAVPIVIDAIQIYPATGPSMNDGSIDITVTGGVPPYTFEWTLNGMIVSYLEDPTGLVPGIYTLTIRDKNNCTIVSQEIKMDYISATSSLKFKDLKVFPNPFNEIIFVEGSVVGKSGSKITLTDILGRSVNIPIEIIGSKAVIHTNVLTSGVYVISIEDASDFIRLKVSNIK